MRWPPVDAIACLWEEFRVTEPSGERVAVPARELALEPDLPVLRDHSDHCWTAWNHGTVVTATKREAEGNLLRVTDP